MKKTIALVMALVMTAALLVGCGGQGNAGNSKFETSDTYTLKMHLSVAATDPVYASAEKFVELVEAKTDGKVTFELYPSSSLGVTSDCLEGLSMRACDVVYDSMSNLSTWNELANIEALPTCIPALTTSRPCGKAKWARRSATIWATPPA